MGLLGGQTKAVEMLLLARKMKQCALIMLFVFISDSIVYLSATM